VRYTRTHEWVELEKNAIVTVGISNRVQDEFGAIVFIDLPAEGEEFEQYDTIGTIESIDGDIRQIHAPVTGTVVKVNNALENSPGLINKSPEDDGWIVKIRIDVPKEINTLMTPSEYEEYEEEDYIDEDEEYEDEDEDEDY
jgi:glycine cleavage system H protein